jgi:hypothetical protein
VATQQARGAERPSAPPCNDLVTAGTCHPVERVLLADEANGREDGRMRTRTLGVAVALLVAVGAVAGCTSNGGSSAGGNGGSAVHGGVAAAPSAAGGAGGAASLQRRGGPSSGGDVAVVGKLTPAAEIRTARLTVAVKGWQHVGQQADAADAVAARAGGEVTADDRSSGRHATATVVVRVPPAVMQPTLAALARLGTEKSRESSTVDVTQQVADVSSRVVSAQQAIARLRLLYNKATKVRDVIRIESELASREADLESLQARQRALGSRTALATITLHLVTAAVVAPKKRPTHHLHGFVGGLERGWHGFTTAVAWLAVAVGTLLPFLLTLLVLGVVAWQLRRRLRRGTGAPPQAPPAAASE